MGKFRFQGQRVTISTDFDNGHLSRVEESTTNVFEIFPYAEDEYVDGGMQVNDPPRKGGSNFTFHFKVERAEDETVRLRLHVKERQKEGGGSVVYANPGFPVVSYDGDTWASLPGATCADGPQGPGWKTITAELRVQGRDVYLAHQYPYTNARLIRYLSSIQDNPLCRIGVAGWSTEGRILPFIEITDPTVPARTKRVACFTGLQHCAELAAGWGLEGMMDYLRSDAAPARAARRKYLFRFIPIVNADGVAEGCGRIHSSGLNLNREWNKDDAVPEVASIKQTFRRWADAGQPIYYFLDVHGFSSKTGRWTFFVEPEGVYKGEQARQYARIMELIGKHLPAKPDIRLRFKPDEGPSEASHWVQQEYGVLSMCVDGWPYPFDALEGTDLDSHYKKGTRYSTMEELKESGALLIQALAEF